MNARGTQITATDLPLVPMNADRTRALVTKETWETALTVILTQVSFLDIFVTFYIVDYKTWVLELRKKAIWPYLGRNTFPVNNHKLPFPVYAAKPSHDAIQSQSNLGRF